MINFVLPVTLGRIHKNRLDFKNLHSFIYQYLTKALIDKIMLTLEIKSVFLNTTECILQLK